MELQIHRIFYAVYRRLILVTDFQLIPTVNLSSMLLTSVYNYRRSELWNLFKYSKLKLKNQKPVAVDDFFSGLSNDTTLMKIPSGRTIPLIPSGFPWNIFVLKWDIRVIQVFIITPVVIWCFRQFHWVGYIALTVPFRSFRSLWSFRS